MSIEQARNDVWDGLTRFVSVRDALGAAEGEP